MNTDRHLIAEVERLRDENAEMSNALKAHESSHQVFELQGHDGVSIRLTPTERVIVKVLFDRQGRVVSYEGIYEILFALRAADDLPSPENIKVHVCKIRRKLVGWRITTVFGAGYILERVDA